MRISVTVFVILISTYVVNASLLDPVIENVVHLQATKPPSGVSGIWKKKTIWKPRWVKEWKSAKVMKPIWKKVWSPVMIREWVPIPKPPPGWGPVSTPLAVVKAIHTESTALAPVKTAPTESTPLWDPVPYPESQQPPPPPPPQPLYQQDNSCGRGDCDSHHSSTFNQEQISEIITSNSYQQNADYSETVTHLTRVPPGTNAWKSPLEPAQLHSESNFNYPELPPYLIPPRFQTFSDSVSQYRHAPPKPILNQPPIVHTPPWTPLPPQNSLKGHFITKPPEPSVKGETNPPNNKENHHPVHGANDFIQEAQLVGEYHYSEFDIKPSSTEANKISQQKPTTETKPRQTRTETKPPQQPPKNPLNFHLQKAVTKEILPAFKPLQSLPSNHRFAPLPESKRPQHNPTPIPHNHKPSPPKLQPPKPTQQKYNHTTTTTTTTTEATYKPIFIDNVQIVYSVPPPNQPTTTTTKPLQTTTPPSTSSSSPTTTETVTKSPVYIVTPITTIKL